MHQVSTQTAIQAIIAAVADQGVVAFQAGQHIGTLVADEDVVQHVAGAVDVGAAGQREVFNIVGQGVGDAGFDCVNSSVQPLDYDVADIVYHVSIVAQTTLHQVLPQPTIQYVVTRIASQQVIKRITCTVEIARTGQHQALDIVVQGIVKTDLHRIQTRIGCLNNHVTGVIHQIGIIAKTALHNVCSRTSVQHVVTAVASDHVIQSVTCR